MVEKGRDRRPNIDGFDLELDSTESIESHVDELVSARKARRRPTAFERMAVTQ
jgi:hypothetical protein